MVNKDFKRGLFFLCSSHTLLHVFTDVPLVLLPILIVEYGFSIFTASVIVAIPKIFSLVFIVPSGLLADRFSHTKMISFSLLLQVLGASIIVLFPFVETLVIGFSLIALASTFYHPSALSATSNITPSGFLSRGLGIHGASGTFGISLGPISLGLIKLFFFDWKFTYLLWMFPIFIVGIIAMFVKIDEILLETQNENESNEVNGFVTSLKGVLSITFISFLLLMLFRSAASGTISTYLTTFLSESKGIEVELGSIVFGLNLLFGLISVVVGGYAGDKLGWKKSLTSIVAIAVIALFGMYIVTPTPLTVIFYLTYGFFSIMTMPITTSLVAKIVPVKSRGVAFGLQFIPEITVGVVMPIILGILINYLKIWIIFPIALAFYIIVLGFTQILKV